MPVCQSRSWLHASPTPTRSSTTLNVYAHAVAGGDRDAAIGLAALLDTRRTGRAVVSHLYRKWESLGWPQTRGSSAE